MRILMLVLKTTKVKMVKIIIAITREGIIIVTHHYIQFNVYFFMSWSHFYDRLTSIFVFSCLLADFLLFQIFSRSMFF